MGVILLEVELADTDRLYSVRYRGVVMKKKNSSTGDKVETLYLSAFTYASAVGSKRLGINLSLSFVSDRKARTAYAKAEQ